jgi:DNA repair protein RecN (Recombination protein N)
MGRVATRWSRVGHRIRPPEADRGALSKRMLDFANTRTITMLRLLSIRNFAVISDASVEFGDGLNLLTGETGSGKSIIVDALGLLLGGRTSADVVRAGTSATHIEGVFAVDANREVQALLADAGVDVADGEIIIRREVSDKARSRAFVNDRLVTLSLLKSMRPFLVDIHGQGDQQNLLFPESHVDLLDEFGGHGSKRAEVSRRFDRFADLRREYERLRSSEAERLRGLDVLDFQVGEVERAALTAGEDEQLERERALLVNAEKLMQVSNEAYGLLYEAEPSILSLLGVVDRRVEVLARFDDRFSAYRESLASTKYALEDLVFFLRDYLQDVDFSSDRLKAIEERLVEIDRLKRKYGSTVADVLQVLDQMRERRNALVSSEARASVISADLSAAKERYLEAARELSEARHRVARELEFAVSSELVELAMESTLFSISLESDPTGETIGASGIDRVEFLVATNPGEESKPLARIASGGEVSRLMLALKTVSSPPEIPRTLVFDEVDVGIGGRVSEAIGVRLSNLSRSNQVLCVTHQAQIARFADAHFSVRKEVLRDRAEASIIRLDRRGQVEELARMIGGSEITETTRRHARELLRVRNT